ncbi:MAG: DUF1624 domain-containing protein [Carboxylicivirga sp.]|jgi:hypothetical protein|nr:DUF1624 domain-containing protein [Carboxylicivirga sp.]
MNMVSKLFSNDQINTGRQIELDVARALAVFFMVLVHAQMYFLKDVYVESTWGLVIDFMGGVPAAPVFMFLMGVGFLYSKKTSYMQIIKRGLIILASGYLLNLLRDTIPELIDYLSTNETSSLTEAAKGFIDVDILHFAGIAMVFWGLLMKFNCNTLVICIITLTLSVVNLFLLNVQVDNLILKVVTGLFWGSSELSEFPFLTWFYYPALGYLFAKALIRCSNKKKFYHLILIVSIMGLALSFGVFYGIYQMDLGMSSEIAYYHHNLFANITYGFFCLLWISIIFLVLAIIPKFILNTFKRWSKHVTEIYFIHWLFISWLSWIFYDYSISIFPYLVLSIGIFIITDMMALMYKQRRKEQLG